MGTPSVVVGGIGPERPIEMASTLDERPIQTLGPDGLDDPLRVGVGVGRPDRSPDYPCSLRVEDLVEWSDELGVPVTNEKPYGGGRSSRFIARFLAC
jgi:hypothetical protein